MAISGGHDGMLCWQISDETGAATVKNFIPDVKKRFKL